MPSATSKIIRPRLARPPGWWSTVATPAVSSSSGVRISVREVFRPRVIQDPPQSTTHGSCPRERKARTPRIKGMVNVWRTSPIHGENRDYRSAHSLYVGTCVSRTIPGNWVSAVQMTRPCRGPGVMTILDRPGVEARVCECDATVEQESRRLLAEGRRRPRSRHVPCAPSFSPPRPAPPVAPRPGAPPRS